MKKLTSWVTIISLSLLLALTGCGKPAADSKDNKQASVQERESIAGDKEDIESSEQVVDSDEPTADEENIKSSDTDQAESSENQPAETPEDSEQGSSGVATPSGFTYPNAIQDLLADENGAKIYNLMKDTAGCTDEQIELLCACVKESVINNYLKPNSLTAEDIKWPISQVSEDGFENWDSTGWAYLEALITRDEMGGDHNDKVMSEDTMPDEQMCKLMDSVYKGLVTWQSLSERNSPRMTIPEKIFPALDYSTE